jgi:hypothetical protein
MEGQANLSECEVGVEYRVLDAIPVIKLYFAKQLFKEPQ